MGQDRFVEWKDERPAIEALAAVLQDFLGPRWQVLNQDPWITANCDDPCTFPLTSQFSPAEAEDHIRSLNERGPRGFEVFHLSGSSAEAHTSVITRQADEFTCALADRYAAIIARWFKGIVEKE